MPLKDLKNTIDAGKMKSALKTENEWLKKRLNQTLEQLEDARNAHGLELPARTNQQLPMTYARVIIADLHGSHADTDVVNALLQDMEAVDVRDIVMLGDMMECGGWLAQSHTLGYVAQIDESAYEDDIAATNDFLDRLQEHAPRAKLRYLQGNHEQRIERWCVDAALQHKRNAEFLMRAVDPEHVLSLSARGIAYYKIGESHSGLSDRGIVKLGKSYFTHGFSTAKHAASATVERFAGCVFYGHTHRADCSPTRMVNVGLVSAWCPGCLCQLAPRWNHNKPSSWTQGYIIQIVNSEDETFHAIQVPIDRGRSYLTGLLKSLQKGA